MAETPTPTEVPQTTQGAPQQTPENLGIAQIIADSEKEPPRETLTKIAKLKQFGTYGLMGLMVVGMLAQLGGKMMTEEEGQSSGGH